MVAKPKDIVRIFVERVDLSRSHYESLISLVGPRPQITNMVAEQFMLSVCVQWESFLHDISVGYVAEYPKKFVTAKTVSMRQSIEKKFGSFALRKVKIKFPVKLSGSQMEDLMDHKGWNISLTSAEKLSQFANSYFPAGSARKFSFSNQDGKFIDLVFALRNLLSHGSRGAKSDMKIGLNNLSIAEPSGPMGVRLSSLPAFLREEVQVGNATLHKASYISNRLCDIANELT